MYLSKLFVCHQICTMGEGRLVSPPSVDTGLRVAWARSGILSKGMRRNFGPILASGIFFMFYQLDFDSHVIQTILLSTEWGGASAWFAVDRNTQHQELHDSFHRWSFSIDLKKKTLILNSGGGLLPWFAMDLDRAGVKYFIFEPGNQCHIWTIKKLCSFFRHQGSPLLQKSDYIWLYLPQFPYCNYIVKLKLLVIRILRFLKLNSFWAIQPYFTCSVGKRSKLKSLIQNGKFRTQKPIFIVQQC